MAPLARSLVECSMRTFLWLALSLLLFSACSSPVNEPPVDLVSRNLGPWNMDNSNGVLIAYGELGFERDDLESVVSVEVLTFDDDDINTVLLDYRSISGNPSGTFNFGATGLVVSRFPGEWFDSVSYDDTSINRGVVNILLARE